MLVLYGLREQIVLIVMNGEVGSAVMTRSRESSISHVDGSMIVLWIHGLVFGTIGEPVKLLAIGVEVCKLDDSDGSKVLGFVGRVVA